MAALTAVNTGRIAKKQRSDQASSSTTEVKQVRHKVVRHKALNKVRIRNKVNSEIEVKNSKPKVKQIKHKVARHETQNEVKIRNRNNSEIEVKNSTNLRHITNSAKKANSVRSSEISPIIGIRTVTIEKLHEDRTEIEEMKKVTRTKQNHSTSFLIRTTSEQS